MPAGGIASPSGWWQSKHPVSGKPGPAKPPFSIQPISGKPPAGRRVPEVSIMPVPGNKNRIPSGQKNNTPQAVSNARSGATGKKGM